MQLLPGLHINQIPPADPHDPRGPTYEWCKHRTGLQVTIYKRKAGTLAGNHYHKGDDPSKNPEYFFLIEGKLKLTASSSHNTHQCEEIIEGGTELIIGPHISHSMEALTDIIFIEYRSTVFDKNNPDTYPS